MVDHTGSGKFPVTRLSAIIGTSSPNPEERTRAFEVLVYAYWMRVYKYVRIKWNKGSTIKGLIAGILIGFFAKKFNSLPLGIVFGLAVGFMLAFLVAFLQKEHYFEIILPGSILGIVVGFATQRYGRPAAQASR